MKLKEITSTYSPRFPSVVAYMLQSTEYQSKPYLNWLWRTTDFSKVQNRRVLERTSKAKLLEAFLRLGMALEIIAGIVLLILGIITSTVWEWELGIPLIISYPFVWSHLVVIPLELGRILVVEPNERKLVAQSTQLFAKHEAVKIAVAGSYGKTTMKELLNTTIGEGRSVAATVANKNVAIEHAKFAKSLNGKEEVLIIEFGEGAPGDVERFSQTTKPTHAVITGLAPAHLDKYKTIEAAGKDIFYLASFLKGNNVFVNGESEAVRQFIKPNYLTYDSSGVGDWKVSGVKVGIEGLSFNLSSDKLMLNLKSSLIGRHQIGPLSAVAAIAFDLGLSKNQIEKGIAKTCPFEHRMQPYNIGGAWIIDDTYNGNIEGIKAGTQILKELKAKRKIYITPGLVDQGQETERIHLEMGKLIALSSPDLVILMNNSVSSVIKKGLEQNTFKGEVQIVDDPLFFYSNIEHMVAKGDIVLMQNDWTDNYS